LYVGDHLWCALRRDLYGRGLKLSSSVFLIVVGWAF